MPRLEVRVVVEHGPYYGWLQKLVQTPRTTLLESVSHHSARNYHESLHPDGTATIDTPETRTSTHLSQQPTGAKRPEIKRFGRMYAPPDFLRWEAAAPPADTANRHTLRVPLASYGGTHAFPVVDTYLVHPDRSELVERIVQTFPALVLPPLVVSGAGMDVVTVVWSPPQGAPVAVERLGLGWRVPGTEPK